MTINCKGKLIDLSTPKVMGILNLTPDSFYDGGKYRDHADCLNQVERMLHQGATFIDVGAYSSRPNAEHVSEAEELRRLTPVLSLILKEFPEVLISVDTFRAQVAKAAIEAGAALINDISAGQLDAKMMATVGGLKVPYIMMHMRGTPQTMQKQTHYDDLIKEVLFYFSERLVEARSHGITNIIVDPGFGFAKTREQNFNLLNQLELFQSIEHPLLVGISRKSMIYKTLGISVENALNGTSILNTIAIEKGAAILRVHDVKEAMECVQLMNALKA